MPVQVRLHLVDRGSPFNEKPERALQAKGRLKAKRPQFLKQAFDLPRAHVGPNLRLGLFFRSSSSSRRTVMPMAHGHGN